ncbi:MAG: hypothetical protein ACFHU9_12860 [Fluviicola sp.]
MIRLLFTIICFFVGSYAACAQVTTIDLESSQSMCITGKGPGQDGAINPYNDGPSTAVVKNLSDDPFNVRLQKDGVILRTIAVEGKTTKEIPLEIGEEMYFDSTMPTKVRVKFKKGID